MDADKTGFRAGAPARTLSVIFGAAARLRGIEGGLLSTAPF